MTGREQTRRELVEQLRDDAVYLRSFHDEAKWWPIADRIDALLTELEQAERERDRYKRAYHELDAAVQKVTLP